MAFFVLASVLYEPPPDSAHNSYESTERGADGAVKDLPADGVVANRRAR